MLGKKRTEWDRYPSGLSENKEQARKAAHGKVEATTRAWRIKRSELVIYYRRIGNEGLPERILWHLDKKP